MGADIQQRNLIKSPFSVTENYSSTGQGHHGASVTTNNSGSKYVESANASAAYINTPRQEKYKDDYASDIAGASSRIISDIDETVANSKVTIVGNSTMSKMGYQEAANRAMMSIVAARSQPNEQPDTEALAKMAKNPSLPSSVLNGTKSPDAKELQEKMNSANPPTAAGFGRTIVSEAATMVLKIAQFVDSCVSATLSEVQGLQSSLVKDSADKNAKSKQKMYDKMSDNAKQAFEQGAGANLLAAGANPTAALAPVSTENAPKKKVFDDKEYVKQAMEAYTKPGGIMDIERRL